MTYVRHSVSSDERDLSRSLLRVGPDELEELNEFRGLHRGSNLDSNWILNMADVFDVGVVELTRSVSNPNKGGAEVVVLSLKFPCHGVLVVQENGFVRNVDDGLGLLLLELVEAEGLFSDSFQNVMMEAHVLIRLHKVKVPGRGEVDNVIEAVTEKASDVVERSWKGNGNI